MTTPDKDKQWELACQIYDHHDSYWCRSTGARLMAIMLWDLNNALANLKEERKEITTCKN